jgi:hypothetical protein
MRNSQCINVPVDKWTLLEKFSLKIETFDIFLTNYKKCLLQGGSGPFIYVNRSLKSSYHVIYTPRAYLHKIILFASLGAGGREPMLKCVNLNIPR